MALTSTTQRRNSLILSTNSFSATAQSYKNSNRLSEKSTENELRKLNNVCSKKLQIIKVITYQAMMLMQ